MLPKIEKDFKMSVMTGCDTSPEGSKKRVDDYVDAMESGDVQSAREQRAGLDQKEQARAHDQLTEKAKK